MNKLLIPIGLLCLSTSLGSIFESKGENVFAEEVSLSNDDFKIQREEYQNLISFGDNFLENSSIYSTGGAATMEVSTSMHFSGDDSLKIQLNDVNDFVGFPVNNLAKGKYTLSYYVYIENPSQNVRFSTLTVGKLTPNEDNNYLTFSDKDNWEYHIFEFNNIDAGTISIFFRTFEGNGTFYIDNISLHKSPVHQDDNLIFNGSFENGKAGWFAPDNTNIYESYSDGYIGNCLKITGGINIYCITKVKANHKYQLSYYLKTDIGDSLGFLMSCFYQSTTGEASITPNESKTMGCSNWTRFSFELVADTSYANDGFMLVFQYLNDYNTVYLDEVSLVEIVEDKEENFVSGSEFNEDNFLENSHEIVSINELNSNRLVGIKFYKNSTNSLITKELFSPISRFVQISFLMKSNQNGKVKVLINNNDKTLISLNLNGSDNGYVFYSLYSNLIDENSKFNVQISNDESSTDDVFLYYIEIKEHQHKEIKTTEVKSSINCYFDAVDFCPECFYKKEYIKEDHFYKTTKKATCTSVGKQICQTCGKEEIIEKTPHTWNKDFSCGDKGKITCQACKSTFNIPEEHELSHCFGFDHFYHHQTCLFCNKQVDTPHEFDYVVINESTLNEEGTYRAYCKNCDFVSNKAMEKLTSNIWTKVLTKLPTCEEDGTADYISKYGTIRGVIEPKTGHKYVLSFKAPTCLEDGESEHWYCEICGEPKPNQNYVTLDKLGHDFSEWIVVKNPTQDSEGLMRRICLRDNSHYEEKTIPILNSENYTEKTLRVASNTETGLILYSNAEFGDFYFETPKDSSKAKQIRTVLVLCSVGIIISIGLAVLFIVKEKE